MRNSPWPLTEHGQSGWTPAAVPWMPREQPDPVNNTCRRTACQASPQTGWTAQHRTGRNKRQCKDRRTQTKRASGAVGVHPQPCGERRWTCCETNAALPPTTPPTQTTIKSPETLKKGEDEGGTGGKTAINADARPPRDKRSPWHRFGSRLRCTALH